jgi:tetratricopeptide (TPR) repeat protein
MDGQGSMLDRAIAMLEAGDPVGAEALLAETVQQAGSRHGPQSPQRAAALFDLANIQLAVRDFGRAVDTLRDCCAIPATGQDATRARLTYLMNLGEVLTMVGELDEAEQVLRESLAERGSFYGEDHAGYAFGLEPLAGVLLRKGTAQEAAGLVERALQILWDEGNPQVARTLALRAQVRKAAHGPDAPGYDGLEQLPDELLEESIRHSLFLAEQEAAPHALAALAEQRERVERHRGADDDWLIGIASTQSNVARELDDLDARLESLDWLRDAMERRGDTRQAIDVALAIALAHSDSGNTDTADRAYREALARAERGDDRAALSAVQRNYGLFLSDSGRPDDAAPLLQDAVVSARGADDAVMLGRSLVAGGIFVQHRGQLDEARLLLEEAVSLLPADEPDILFALSHLNAIEVGGSCGCGDMSAALSTALRRLVLNQLPEGLLDDLQLTLKDDGSPDVRVDLAREPTQEEMEHLDRVLHQGLATLRGAASRRGYPR